MKLTASDIHVELGGNEILKGIDAAIKEKEFVGIIGPNGSGKSTLLKCIYRVLKPDTGVIMLDGKPLNEYKVRILQKHWQWCPSTTTIILNFPYRKL